MDAELLSPFPAQEMDHGGKDQPLLTLDRVGGGEMIMSTFWLYLLIIAIVTASAVSKREERAMATRKQ